MADDLNLKLTATLTPAQIREAVQFWLNHQGYDVKSTSFGISRGDRPGDVDEVYCTAQIEPKRYAQDKD